MIHQLLFAAAETIGNEQIKSVLAEHPREAVLITSLPPIAYAVYREQWVAASVGLGLLALSLYQIEQHEKRQREAAQVPAPTYFIHPADVAGGWRPRPNRFYEYPTTVLH